MVEHFLPGLVKGHPALDVPLLGEQDHLLGSLVLAAGLLVPGSRALSLDLEEQQGGKVPKPKEGPIFFQNIKISFYRPQLFNFVQKLTKGNSCKGRRRSRVFLDIACEGK